MLTAGGMLAQSSPAADALDSLRALKSVTEVGVNYPDYKSRVLDAKIKVDKYLATPEKDDAAQRAKIKSAMQLYVLAERARYAYIRRDVIVFGEVGDAVMNDSELAANPAIAEIISQSRNRKENEYNDAIYTKKQREMLIRNSRSTVSQFVGKELGANPIVLFECAAKQLAAAK